MDKPKVHMASIVEKDANGNVMSGIKFWWTEGSGMATYHEWEHNASGPTFSDVMPEPVVQDPEGKIPALKYTVEKCWLRQVDMEWLGYDENFC